MSRYNNAHIGFLIPRPGRHHQCPTGTCKVLSANLEHDSSNNETNWRASEAAITKSNGRVRYWNDLSACGLLVWDEGFKRYKHALERGEQSRDAYVKILGGLPIPRSPRVVGKWTRQRRHLIWHDRDLWYDIIKSHKASKRQR